VTLGWESIRENRFSEGENFKGWVLKKKCKKWKIKDRGSLYFCFVIFDLIVVCVWFR